MGGKKSFTTRNKEEDNNDITRLPISCTTDPQTNK